MTLLCCAAMEQHGIKTGGLDIPENIELFHIPPYTPEMNPIEQIWKEIRKCGFRKVMDRLSDTICSRSNQTVASITGRTWILKCLN